LHTAIVIDASRSLTADEIEAQRAVVASYVAQVPPQTRVQVIAYARDAKALLPSWMPAVTAAAQIDREIRSLAPRNGSNLDVAIDEAASWLSRAKGTRRLIVISDERLPTRIDTLIAGFADRLPEKTLAHVVALWVGTQGLQRVEDLELSPLATATEGMSTSASVDDSGKLDARMLVRPTGIDNVAIAGEGWTAASSPIEGEGIDNGTSLTWFGIGSPVSGPISISGFIWGHRITRIAHPDPSRGRSIARELSAAGSFLDDDFHELVARAAFAVNESWSLMVTWGGTGGFADLGGGGFASGGFCCDTGGSTDIGHGTATGGVHLDFKKQLAPVVARCGAQGVALSIVIETTREEIVDVHVTGHDDAMRACIEEAVWATSLQIPNAPSHTTTSTKF
jgi:hypothetical protein